MIKSFQLLRNIGNFDSVDAGRHITLGRLNLCYADNGRGKTTLASVLRSLAEEDPVPIVERKRLSSQHDPHVVIELAGGSSPLVFKNGTWNGGLHSLVVFDDTFVEQNVYSGLTVSPQQRQHLHDLILGPQAVALQKQLDQQVEKIENHNRQLRVKEGEVPVSARGQISIEQFCALPSDPDIDEKIKETEFLLAAAQEQDAIGSTPAFDLLNLSKFDLTEVDRVLQMDLDSLERTALEHVQSHLASLSRGGETWVADGMGHIVAPDDDASKLTCPFCAQNLDGSSLIQHYRAYFSDAYSDLKRTITGTLEGINATHGEGNQAEFERKLRIVGERRQFWARFCEVEELTLDTSEIFKDFEAARDCIISFLIEKQASPLEKIQVPEEVKSLVAAYENHITTVTDINQRLHLSNQAIKELKDRKSSASVTSLSDGLNHHKAVKSRYTPGVVEACDSYLQEIDAKTETEKAREQTRTALNYHREIVFPKYQTTINRYLEKFGAGFRLSDMKHANLRAGSTSTYNAQVGDTSITVGNTNPAPAKPSFGSVLSGGDRNTLAFAFFLSSLDQRSDLKDTIVVIDDPISSMDADRSLTTVQEIRSLTQRAGQVVVLSHDKRFLCSIWRHASKAESVAFEIARSQGGSTLRNWNVTEDSLTEHDRRHKVLQEFMDNGTGELYQVARDIRPHLEGYLRTVCPQDFPPGSSVGNQFLEKCRQRLKGSDEILSETKLQELRDILEYAHKFQHDSNPHWDTEPIVDGELRTFVGRALAFTKP